MSRGPTVYFVQSGQDGPIKIGYTEHLSSRLSTIRTHAPVGVRLLLCLPGTAEDERRLHDLFGWARGSGEWFRPAAEILRFIEEAAVRGALFPDQRAVRTVVGGRGVLRALYEAVEAHKRATAETDEQIAERAGLKRESFARVMRKGRTGEGDAELMTVEKIARAIDHEVALRPKITTPDEYPSDTCGPCRAGRHAKCYAPCLCADRGHAPKGGAS